MKSGVYQITNKQNGKFYIGSSRNIIKRWYTHLSKLKKNKHENPHLQNSFNKYGQDTLKLSFILLTSDKQLMLHTEQQLLNKFVGMKKCYNINDGVTDLNGTRNPFYGKHHTETAKQKMSVAKQTLYSGKNHPQYGKPKSEITRTRISKSRIGQFVGSNHCMFDTTIYTFTNETKTFTGTRFDFYTKYQLNPSNVSWLIKGIHKSVKGWRLVQQKTASEEAAV